MFFSSLLPGRGHLWIKRSGNPFDLLIVLQDGGRWLENYGNKQQRRSITTNFSKIKNVMFIVTVVSFLTKFQVNMGRL